MQAKPFGCEVLADNCHAQIAAVAPTKLAGEGVVEHASLDGQIPGLAQQVFPCLIGQAVPMPVRARVLPPVVEEAHIVVLRFQGFDLGVDKRVEFCEEFGDIRGYIEVHEEALAFLLCTQCTHEQVQRQCSI